MSDPTHAFTVAQWLRTHGPALVITGAGVSTDSGIPDYRDDHGDWKRPAPILHKDFVGSAATRQRYWARSYLGWQHFAAAGPNRAHRALAALQAGGWVGTLITQNVDRLHQRAGSRDVIDLHGRLDRVGCLQCGHTVARDAWQQRLQALNPDWDAHVLRIAPDGDADLHEADYRRFQVPSCARCGGVMKPGVVFYGGTLDPQTREAARAAVRAAPAVLVAGSSLMVASAYTLVRQASEQGLPVAAINRGRTRADALLQAKWVGNCGELLEQAAARLAGEVRAAG